ncbi:hypothetical protein SHIRM173S_05287 [Streptomyces hirsutus]
MTTTAASSSHHLSPAFPGRAPWGTAGKLRAWQQGAMERYLQTQPRDFLAVATPGAGKTTFALTLASWLLHHHVVQQVTVVAPTEHLKKQWAEAAARIGIKLDPEYSAGPVGKDYDGVAVTYAGVGVRPMLHRNRSEQRKTLVILDEIHHAGDSKSWGEACLEAFEPATRRLALTGTPFRSDTNPIPFVAYEEGDDGIRRSAADYTYGYGSALRDNVVRPVIFLSYSGNMRWRTKAGDEIEARLGEPMTKDAVSQAWRTALDPRGEWMPSVLRAADQRLTEVRKSVPDAGALVIAADQDSARAYAKLIREITGSKATVVLSDDTGASKRIDEFSGSDDRWMVAVRMVSEGVDVPRLAVGVYATTISTPLFFAQAVGRFVRSRRRGETASVFLPTVPDLLTFANEMERERDHASQEEATRAALGYLDLDGKDIEVDLKLADVGGPSAGLLFSLGIVDKLNGDDSGGDLTGGRIIAGTGTIDAEGRVGTVGGVPLKTQAARRDGATVFLVPEAECAAAQAELPDGLRLIPVTTLEGTVDALVDLEKGAGKVPSC